MLEILLTMIPAYSSFSTYRSWSQTNSSCSLTTENSLSLKFRRVVYKWASIAIRQTKQWVTGNCNVTWIMCNIRFIALTLVWTVNFTLSLSLKASEISTISDVSVFKSTDWVRVWNRKGKVTSADQNKIILPPSPQGHRLKIKSAH